MPKNRVKIDLYTNDGNKLTISLEGHLTREKVTQILDFVDILGGSQPSDTLSNISKYDKIQNIIRRKFPIGWFTSQEVMVAYEDVFDEPIGLSTVSTYLSRLTQKNFLNKSGSTSKRKYKANKSIKRSKSHIIR